MAPSRAAAAVVGTRRGSSGRLSGHVSSAPRSKDEPQKASKAPLIEDPPPPMCTDEVAAYVQPYGYSALGPSEWQRLSAQTAWPKITFTVAGHIEVDEHTYYQVKCELDNQPTFSYTWGVHRRLLHLREGLHDFVQSCLAESYNDVFGDAPFARRGGLPGTSARLQAWLEHLAQYVNDGTAPPLIVAHIFNFFEAPKPPAGATVAALLDFSDMLKPQCKASLPRAAAPDAVSSQGRFSDLAVGPGSTLLQAPRKVCFADASGAETKADAFSNA